MSERQVHNRLMQIQFPHTEIVSEEQSPYKQIILEKELLAEGIVLYEIPVMRD